ncbi:MAG: hypothetical protein ACRDD8_02940 [Bacteroidales bacterium]
MKIKYSVRCNVERYLPWSEDIRHKNVRDIVVKTNKDNNNIDFLTNLIYKELNKESRYWCYSIEILKIDNLSN